MHLSALLLGMVYFAVAQPPATPPGSVTLDQCLIFLDEEAEVPAQEAGVIAELPAKEGQDITKGGQVAQIDDSIPKMQLDVAKSKYMAAEFEANNKIPEEYATSAKKVAWAAYDRSVQTNKQMPGTVPKAIVEEQILAHEEKVKSIEKAQMDRAIAGKQKEVARSEMDAAQTNLQHRRLCSPLDGQVRKIYRHVGEWVQPGDSVVHVVRMNRLRTEGFLKASQYSPNEVTGKPVMIEVTLARGRVLSFPGKIVFVDPMVQPGGEYLVRAEVQNREENGQWLLRPGMTAKMTIQLK